jgi:ribosomal protein S18 acetylase RimI-like enzyme
MLDLSGLRCLDLDSRLRTARLIAMGVRPEFRQHGVAEMLVLRIIEEAMLKLGFKGELSMTWENNVMINRFLEAIGAVPYKTYPIYSRGLEGEKPTA